MKLFEEILKGMFESEKLMELLRGSKVIELKQCARVYGIKKYYKMKKAELIDAIFTVETNEMEIFKARTENLETVISYEETVEFLTKCLDEEYDVKEAYDYNLEIQSYNEAYDEVYEADEEVVIADDFDINTAIDSIPF